ncbi:MAG: ABC transporter ATP-binding protein/permease [Rickettsiales bacterium]|jgi:ATP-binding cassette subfamily B protein|nr:ABC transporter ATP-binding protein/permease [Rickettsiales bacterium]
MPKNNVDYSLPKKPSLFLWKFLKYYSYSFSLTVLLTITSDGLHLAAAQYFLKIIIDGLLANQINLSNGLLLTVIYSFFFLSNHLFLPLIRKFRVRAISTVQMDMRNELFYYTTGHPLEFFMDNFAGNLNARIVDIVNGTKDILLKVADIFSSVFIFALLASLFSRKSRLVSILLFSWMSVYGVLFILIARMIMKASREKSEKEGKYSGSVVDCFTSIYNVKSFSMESRENIKRKLESGDILEKDIKLSRLKSLMDIFNFASNFALVFLVFIISIKLFLENRITLGDLTMFVSVIAQVSGWLKYAFGSIVEVFELHGRMEGALNTIIVPSTVENQVQNRLVVSDGKIEISHLYFRYRTSLPLIFSDFSLHLEPNTKLGIVGHSGSGKSTLINLLLRLYMPDGGSIAIDGQNIESVTGESLRESISYIPQDTMLFHRTIAENIAYGKPDASQEEIELAAKKAFCYDFINNFEHKFGTVVGERGVKLSSGQRQRIAIARAILRNSKILLLDEATSALDVLTEIEVQRTLAELMEDKTVIVIAHRLSTLDIVDRIVLLENGKILEDGTKKELMTRNGLFRKMCLG